MMRSLIILVFVHLIVFSHAQSTVGYRIGNIQGYKLLKKSGHSSLYEIDCPEVQDGKPLKLLQLVGTHQEIGYDYGYLLGPQIAQTYHRFMTQELSNPIALHVMELFLEWQYDTLVSKKIPIQFKDEIKGIQKGAKARGVKNARVLIERILVVSSYPGDVTVDMSYAMLDFFLQNILRIRNPALLNWVENNLFQMAKFISKFINKRRIHCSFMAAWGSRTKNGQLYTMRNLDWAVNTGINKNKIIFVWKIKNTIPHTTIGYPGIIGALTGMSKAGLTVHEAGLSSYKSSEHGFQWTLRLRYILMHASNLTQVKKIWHETENTFGMNHMIASAADNHGKTAPVFVVQTMRGYTAQFADLDPRQDGVNFTDPQTKKQFRAGYAMKDAVFRTNHAYDPTINKFKVGHPGINDDSMKRYFMLKDFFNASPLGSIGQQEALNITAIVADKGGPTFYHCVKGKDNGINTMSVMFIPAQQRMYAAMEYGQGDTFKPACCSVYLNLDMKRWFS